MNERIQELKTQSLVCKNGNWDYDIEKFADLIVRECSDLFETEWGEEKLTGNDVGYVLKKHFGVE